MKRSRAASFGWRSFGRRAPPLLPFVRGGGASAARETSLLNPDLADARLLFSTLDPLCVGVVAPRLFQEEPPERHPHGGHRCPPLPGIWEGTIDIPHARDGVVDGDEGEYVLLVHVTGGGGGTASIAMAREFVCHSAVEILAAAHQLFDVMSQRGNATRTRKR